jgi:alkanesulfonate monooxygenase SsuD/methylene tetrahydromethanopterin reductase-like flavin-dependent oxidoreductase (luciferase family)
MERTAILPGPIGLILPTFVQDTAPPWAVAGSPIGEPGRPAPVADAPPSPLDPIAHLGSLCSEAERLGADVLWACDHLFWHGPCLEPMVALTVAATATTTTWLGTSVMQLPLRQAPEVAKQAATLQNLSGGRFILGVGVGSHPGEYAQAGVDYHTRGRLLDAGMAALQRSWASGGGTTSGDPAEAGQARYRHLPDPVSVPVWVGGSSEAALRRAAGSADGWMPLFLSVKEYADAVERLGKECDGAGRHPDEVTPSLALFVSIDDDPNRGLARGAGWMGSLYGLPAKAFARHLVSGTADEVASVVAAFCAAGARHVAIYVTADEPLGQFERLVAALPAAGVRTRE